MQGARELEMWGWAPSSASNHSDWSICWRLSSEKKSMEIQKKKKERMKREKERVREGEEEEERREASSNLESSREQRNTS